MRTADRILVKGWILAPFEVTASSFRALVTLQFLCQLETGGYYEDKVAASAELVGSTRSSSSAYFEKLEILPHSQLIENEEAGVKGRQFQFEGLLNIQSLIPSDESRTYRLSLLARFSDKVALSNVSTITVLPREQWGKPQGGLLFPNVGVLGSDFLLVEGFSHYGKSLPTSVEVYVEGTLLGLATLGLELAELNNAYQDSLVSEKSRFQFLISFENAEEKLTSSVLQRPIQIEVKTLFEDGLEQTFRAPKLLWKPLQNKSELSENIEGEIEKVYFSEEGLLQIDGWMRSPGSARLILEGVRKRFDVTEKDFPGYTVWTKRRDIEARFAFLTMHDSYAFSVRLDPYAFGRFPGQLRLLAELSSNGKQFPLGSEHAWEHATELLQNIISKDTLAEKLVAKTSTSLSRLGVRSAKKLSTSETLKKTKSTSKTKKLSKLLVATNNLSAMEGAPKVLYAVIKHLLETTKGVQVSVVSPCEGDLLARYEALGVTVHVIGRGEASQREFKRLFEQFEPELVFANVIDTAWAVEAAWAKDVPCIWAIHESVDPLKEATCPMARLGLLHRLRGAERLIFVSERTKEVYLPYVEAKNTSVIPNGIDVDAIEAKCRSVTRQMARESLRISEDQIVISIIGTTVERKGQDVFLKGISELKLKNPRRKLKCFVVGAREIPFLSELIRLRQELKLEDVVEFVKETQAVEKYYQASDVLVIASREESAPLVSLEAFAFGVPLVSTTVFGLSEQIVDGVNALAFEMDNAFDLAQKVEKVISNSSLRNDLVEQAKADVKSRFSSSASLSKYRSHIESILPL